MSKEKYTKKQAYREIATNALRTVSAICGSCECTPKSCPFAFERENGDYDCVFDGAPIGFYGVYKRYCENDVHK